MEFEKKIIEVEVLIPVGFEISDTRTKQMYINPFNIVTNQTGYVDGLTEYGIDLISIELRLHKIST